jgi:hypothetical protein
MTAPVTVEIISAPWCKRCHIVKPAVAATCALVGARLTYVEFDDLDEAAQASITSLPTIRMRIGADENGWSIWTANTLDDWTTAIMATASVAPTDTDF